MIHYKCIIDELESVKHTQTISTTKKIYYRPQKWPLLVYQVPSIEEKELTEGKGD